jgi:cytoskeleton protein RodZ
MNRESEEPPAMAEARKTTFINRLTRQKRQPERQDHRLEPPVIQPVTGESVVAELRRARQDLGRDLVRIADDLKIRRVYLEAIEEGRFDDLPGATYAVGFVRAYAEYLGLDSIEIVARFKEEVAGLNQRLQLVFPTPVPESKIPNGAILLISILMIVLAYGGWYYLSSQSDDLEDQVLDLPDSLEPLVSGDREEPAPDVMDSTRSLILAPAEPADADPGQSDTRAPLEPGDEEGPPVTQGPQEPENPISLGGGLPAEFQAEPAADSNVIATFSGVPSTATDAALAPLPTPGAIPAAPAPDALLPGDDRRQPRVYGVENQSARIVLRARLDSWVQVHAADESLLMTRVLQPGDSYRVPDLAGLTLLTGNAGGLDIEVDGAVVPPLGPVGAIRRGIALDPDRLLRGTALPQ